MKENLNRFLAGVPFIADSAGLILLITLLPALTPQMQTWSMGNVLLLTVGYIFFCAAVYSLQKLEPAPEEAPHPRPFTFPRSRTLQASLGILFAVAMMVAFTHQLGYLDLLPTIDTRRLGSGETAAFLVLAPGAWFGFSLFYTLLLISNFEPTIARNSPPYPWVALLALLATNGMLLLVTAETAVIFSHLGINGHLGTVLFAFVLLLLLFGPPRLLYAARQSRPTAVATLLILLFYCSWHIGM